MQLFLSALRENEFCVPAPADCLPLPILSGPGRPGPQTVKKLPAGRALRRSSAARTRRAAPQLPKRAAGFLGKLILFFNVVIPLTQPNENRHPVGARIARPCNYATCSVNRGRALRAPTTPIRWVFRTECAATKKRLIKRDNHIALLPLAQTYSPLPSLSYIEKYTR